MTEMRSFLIFILIISPPLFAKKRHSETSQITNFTEAKKFLSKKLELFDNSTVYCSCLVEGKGVNLKSCDYKVQKDPRRASRLEWEHVVPAEAFGKSFLEWRVGTATCIKRGKQLRGRKCAQSNPEFNKMEGDIYNLFPEIGELNGLRSNYSMAELGTSNKNFGGCKVKLSDRKFEPQDLSKGIVARTYLNFENRYPSRGIVSGKNSKLFTSWDKLYPVTALECKRWKAFESRAGYKHLFADRCI